MRGNETAEQLQLELRVLAQVRRALGVAVRADIRRPTVEQWLERSSFVCESFGRHWRRLLVIERDGGGMEFAACCRPSLAARAQELHAEHEALAAELDETVATSRALSPDNLANVFALRQHLSGLIKRLDWHIQQERELWTDVFLVDMGDEP